jgi:hypothetical protein
MNNIKSNKTKYLKYKAKYLKLKKQIAGADVAIFLPCEINLITKELYFDASIFGIYGSQFSDLSNEVIINRSFVEGSGVFRQDPAILLKMLNNDDASIIVRPDGLSIYAFDGRHTIIPYLNGNDFGGNFISSPNYPDNLGTIFYFENINPALQSVIDGLPQNKCPLSCIFRKSGERHIDECMCFMPYGDSYKVWIYSIRSISINADLTEKVAGCSEVNKNNLYTYINNYAYNPMLGNAVLQGLVGELYAGTTDERRTVILNEFKKIRRFEIGLTGNNLKWFYYFLNKKKYDSIVDLEVLTSILELERYENMVKINSFLFGGELEDNLNKFVIFPLDLTLTDTNYENFDYSIVNVPIFNRLWIETPTKCLCLFSCGSSEDATVTSIIEEEKASLRSMINISKPIIYKYVNTEAFHTSGSIGGNLHCLIKQRMTL